MKFRLLAITVFLSLPLLLCAQTDPIDASRKIDWTSAGIPGGIPDRTTICDTLSAGATAAQINSAIAGCASGQVVFLNAGTYTLSSGITFSGTSNVTLRGAGADQTFLVINGTTGCIQSAAMGICGSSSVFPQDASPVSWTAGYSKGTTQITLSSVAGLSVDEMLVLDQCNDGLSDADCTTGTEADTWPEVWVCGVIDDCSVEGVISGDSRIDVRLQQQIVKVTAIDGNDVTFTPGLYMPNWSSSRTPEAWRWGTVSQISILNGVENLSIDARSCGCFAPLVFTNSYSSWVKGIRIVSSSQRTRVYLLSASHIEIRDSYFWGSAGSSQSYGIEVFTSSDALFINNILHEIATPLNHGMGVGNVFIHNFIYDTSRTDFPTAIGSLFIMHDGGVGMFLLEGNQGPGHRSDAFHGASSFGTLFRNHLSGSDSVNFPALVDCTSALILDAFNRFYNVIGNVLGEASYHDTYEVITPTASSDTAVYNLGINNACGNSTNDADTNLEPSLMRWGNYDTVNDAVRWESSEVPSGLTNYANPVPGDQTLIDSYFFASRPSWFDTPFGNVPWPPIGPDVTGGDISGWDGHANKIPARLCFENTSQTDDILDFNADDCYLAAGDGTTVSGSVTLSGDVKIQ